MAFKGTVDVGAALTAQGLPANKITRLVANASSVTKNKKSGSNDLLTFNNIPFNYPILLSGANSNGGAFYYKTGIAMGTLSITSQTTSTSSGNFLFKAYGAEDGFSTVNVIPGNDSTSGITIDVKKNDDSYFATTLSIGAGILGSGTLSFGTPITSLKNFNAGAATTATSVIFSGVLTSSITAPFTINKGASAASITATFNKVVTASADKAVNVTFIASGSILAITDNSGLGTNIISFATDANHANKLRMTWAGVTSTLNANVSNLDILSITDGSASALNLSTFTSTSSISTIQLEQAPTAASSITNINDNSTVLISPISGAPFSITNVITYNLIPPPATGKLNYSVKGLVNAAPGSNPHQTFAIGDNVQTLNIAFDSHNIDDTKVTLNTLSTALTNIDLDAGGVATKIQLDLGSGSGIPTADVTISPKSLNSISANTLTAFKLSGSPTGSTNTYKVKFVNNLSGTFDISTFTSGNKVAIDSKDIVTITGGDGNINFTDSSTSVGTIDSLTFGTGVSNVVISGNNARTYDSINLGAGDDTFRTDNSGTSTFNVVGAVSSGGENFWKYNATGQNKIIFNGSGGATFLSGADHIKFLVDNQSVAGTGSALYDAALGVKVKKSDDVTFSNPISGDCTTSCSGVISGAQSANVILLSDEQGSEWSDVANINISLPGTIASGGETILVNYKTSTDSYLGALHYSLTTNPDSYVTLFKATAHSAGFIYTDFGFENADGDEYFYERTDTNKKTIDSIQSITKFYIKNDVSGLAGLTPGYPVQAAVSDGGIREVISGGEAPVACDGVPDNWSGSSHTAYQVISPAGACNVINFSAPQSNELNAGDLANLQVSDNGGANANYNKVVIFYHTATNSYLAIGQVGSCAGGFCSITGLTNAYEIVNDITTLSASNIGFYGDFIGISG